jgi:pimeloyl-ACP methyl ester carboxylesterase
LALPRPPGPDGVVLVHGLWTNRVVLGLLARRLRRAGFAPALFGYASRFGNHERNVERLAAFIGRLPCVRLHVVAHSLGGLLALEALGRRPDPRLRRLVLLGTPVQGSHAAAHVLERRWGRVYGGSTVALLARSHASAVRQDLELGVVAGSFPMGLGRIVSGFREPNDGTVLVREAQHPQATDTVVLPVSHTGLLFSARVAAEVEHFLRHGRFASRHQV